MGRAKVTGGFANEVEAVNQSEPRSGGVLFQFWDAVHPTQFVFKSSGGSGFLKTYHLSMKPPFAYRSNDAARPHLIGIEIDNH